MSPRPPTLHEKKRYLLARIEPVGTSLTTRDLYYTVADALTSLWGDLTAASVNTAVIAIEEGYLLLKCQRGYESMLRTALTSVTSCKERKIALRPLKISGTLESLRSTIRERQKRRSRQESLHEQECLSHDKIFIIHHCEGEKVDVIEKGSTDTDKLFLTRADMENFNAATIPDGI